MKKYHVYGIGNALVDIELKVEDSFLSNLDIAKGLMTLVGPEKQKEIFDNAGEEQMIKCCGGSAANTVIALSNLGGKAFYSCKVADDNFGKFYHDDLVASGVESNIGTERPKGITGSCMVMVTPDAERTMNTHLGVSWEISESEINFDEIKNAEYLYIEGYVLTSPTGLDAVLKAAKVARENGVKIAITFSDSKVVAQTRDAFLSVIEDGVDIVFGNLAEAMAFTETESTEAAAQELKKYSKCFAITLGDRGALVYDGDKEVAIVTSKVEAVDTLGAGDLFAGSFLYAITQGHSYAAAGRLACNAASELCTKYGTRLNKEELLKLKKDILC